MSLRRSTLQTTTVASSTIAVAFFALGVLFYFTVSARWTFCTAELLRAYEVPLIPPDALPSDLERCLMTDALARLGGRPLAASRPGVDEVYRLVIVYPRGPEKVVRIERTVEGAVRFLGRIEGEDRVLRSQAPVPLEIETRLLELLDEANFWSERTVHVLHGNEFPSRWLVEGMRQGQYRVAYFERPTCEEATEGPRALMEAARLMQQAHW